MGRFKGLKVVGLYWYNLLKEISWLIMGGYGLDKDLSNIIL
jgi:hypothetical protein